MKSRIGRGAAALFFISPFIAQGQNAQPTDDEINEEIIVTAQKRATSLQDVPFSVAALSSEDLKQSGATNMSTSPATSLASTSRTSGPDRARSRSAASAPARSSATSRA